MMTKMKNNVIGEKVQEARLKCQPPLTQLELAARLQLQGWKISRTGIAKIEAGIRRVTDIEVLKLAKALDIKASSLMGEVE